MCRHAFPNKNRFVPAKEVRNWNLARNQKHRNKQHETEKNKLHSITGGVNGELDFVKKVCLTKRSTEIMVLMFSEILIDFDQSNQSI